MIEVRKKENESASSLIYRFSKKVQQSGVIKEAKKRRYTNRAKSRSKRKISAIAKSKRRIEMSEAKKWGIVLE